MSSNDYFAHADLPEFRSPIDQITDQLCVAVTGEFDFRVRATVADETLERILEAGCNDRLIKPIDPQLLIQSICDACAKAASK